MPKRVGGLNLNWATPPRIWIPLRAAALVIPRFDKVFDSRGAIWLVLVGRLNRGVSISAAQSELQAIAANIGNNRDLSAVVYPLSRSKFWPAYRNDIQSSLMGFSIAAGLILLLACANVSNLLLGRALARQRELAMRLAIGAGRGRIVRQLLTEAGVLAVLSCGAGLIVADGLMRLLRQFPAALGLTLALDLHLESRALAFCITLSAFAILLFGLAPALQTARLAVMPSLKGSRQCERRRTPRMVSWRPCGAPGRLRHGLADRRRFVRPNALEGLFDGSRLSQRSSLDSGIQSSAAGQRGGGTDVARAAEPACAPLGNARRCFDRAFVDGNSEPWIPTGAD